MTIRFRKKVRKWRGRTSHGWGAKKKHRGGGSQGGRGFAGRHKHKYTMVTTTDMAYFGKKGFHSLKKKPSTINVSELGRISKGNSEIDLNSLGYQKLLSRGNADRSYTIKVKSFTKKAKQKIEDAGGKILTK